MTKLAAVLFAAALILTGCGGDTGTVSSSPNPSAKASSVTSSWTSPSRTAR